MSKTEVNFNRRRSENRAGFSGVLIAFALTTGFSLAWLWLHGLCPARAAAPAAFCGSDHCASGAVILPIRVQARGAARARPEISIFMFWRSPGPQAFARRPRRRARSQCDTGANLGFVVHGLWPQYEHGFPSDCGPAARFPSRIALESSRGLYPSEGLARHEWQRHGTCSGKSPTDYFADVRRARDSIVIPSPFAAPKEQQTWTPVDIARAFIAANPRLRPGMLGVACTGSVLQEVRICFSKDLRDFHACPEVSRQGCRVRGVSVPPVL